MINTSIRGIIEALPTDLASKTSVVMPSVAVPPAPGTVEEAIIANGVASYNICKVLEAVADVPVIELLLRLGQKANGNVVRAILSAYDAGTGTLSTAEADYETSFHVPGDDDGARIYPESPLPDGYLATLDTWVTDMATWLTDCQAQIEDAGDALAAGVEYTEADFPEMPALELPVPRDPELPARQNWLVRIINMLSLLIQNPIIRFIVRAIVKRILTGGQNDVMLQLFKKFAFLQEGKVIKPEDLTSLLLLLADKRIEIYDSKGQREIFLDTKDIPDW
jgi:hypothetical protein